MRQIEMRPKNIKSYTTDKLLISLQHGLYELRIEDIGEIFKTEKRYNYFVYNTLLFF